MRSHSTEPGLVSGLWKVFMYVSLFTVISFSLPTVLDGDQSPLQEAERPRAFWGHSWNDCLRPLQAGDNVRARPCPGQWGGSAGGLLEEPASTGDLKEGWEAESLK